MKIAFSKTHTITFFSFGTLLKSTQSATGCQKTLKLVVEEVDPSFVLKLKPINHHPFVMLLE